MTTRDCLLHTMEGVKEAQAGMPFTDYANREVVTIAAKDGSMSIPISAAVCERKFQNETKPTFYAC